MCGICAYIGYNNIYGYLIFGLKMLQNRGYDSAGIVGLDKENNIKLKKYASREDINAVDLLEDDEDEFRDCTIGICHSRWATHGAKTDYNAHPHICYQGKFSLVHNGIIENYEEIKNNLVENYGIEFKSETDTEVIVNLISICYNELNDTEKAINKALSMLEGTWGLVIMDRDDRNRLYCARHGSPLLIGFGKNNKYAIVASEQSGFCRYVSNYICLENHDIIVIEKNKDFVSFYNNKNQDYELKEITIDIGSISPKPYEHWTIKEINEQFTSSMRAIGMGGRIKNDYEVKLGGLIDHEDDLIILDNLIILGCGTSYNAGLHVSKVFKRISGFNSVSVYDGGEFSECDIPRMGKTGLLIISQSGETKDLHRSLELGKRKGLYMIGVINIVDSLIARDVHCGVYLNSGREVGVASTKAFTSQVIVLNMIAVWFAQIRNINREQRYQIIHDLKNISTDIKHTISQVQKVCENIGIYLKDKNSLFVLGRDMNESIAREGALKIKELGYIHAEGYSSVALKHGPYSLITLGTPIIIIIPDDKYYAKNSSIIEEIKSRGAYIFAISNRDKVSRENILIKIPTNKSFQGLLSVIPMQLIAYYLACNKNINPDFPRNLSKTVSVD